MALTDTAIRNLKPRNAPYKKSDGAGALNRIPNRIHLGLDHDRRVHLYDLQARVPWTLFSKDGRGIRKLFALFLREEMFPRILTPGLDFGGGHLGLSTLIKKRARSR